MNWLCTNSISEKDTVENWQKYEAVTVKNHKNTQKPHLFDEISEINHKLLTSLWRWTFSVHVDKNFIQKIVSLNVAVCIEKLGHFSVQK